MPRHFEKRTVSYSAEQMFALVAAVERYPDFLPWCLAAKVYGKNGDSFKADLCVGKKAFHETFSSRVTLKAPSRIVVAYAGGALKHLSNEWTFTPLSFRSCEITFFVDFRLSSGLLGAMMDIFFDTAFRRMVAAFEKRARDLYE